MCSIFVFAACAFSAAIVSGKDYPKLSFTNNNTVTKEGVRKDGDLLSNLVKLTEKALPAVQEGIKLFGPQIDDEVSNKTKAYMNATIEGIETRISHIKEKEDTLTERLKDLHLREKTSERDILSNEVNIGTLTTKVVGVDTKLTALEKSSVQMLHDLEKANTGLIMLKLDVRGQREVLGNHTIMLKNLTDSMGIVINWINGHNKTTFSL